MTEYNTNERRFITHIDNFINNSCKNKKELVMCIGPMFSGKTTLLYKTYQYIENNINIHENINVFVLNSAIDTRVKENVLSSHNPGINGKLNCIKTNSIYNDFVIPHFKKDTSPKQTLILLIDECQFYSDLLYSLDYMFKNSIDTNIFIGCFGLNGDFNATIMGETHKLIPFSKDIIVLHASCTYCKNYALFSHNKLIQKNNNIDSTIISVGGDDKYIPLCNTCFFYK